VLEHQRVNSEDKCLALRNKIEECGYAIICHQEIRKNTSTILLSQNVALVALINSNISRRFGASGGMIII
jgi:hypothetical protein